MPVTANARCWPCARKTGNLRFAGAQPTEVELLDLHGRLKQHVASSHQDKIPDVESDACWQDIINNPIELWPDDAAHSRSSAARCSRSRSPQRDYHAVPPPPPPAPPTPPKARPRQRQEDAGHPQLEAELD
mmetsp:Transcript_25973/g.66168  ORF Transcript_25973/g.66168 Transcript_25973/m.66168 type:complete len:131 (-) Transcript_25973:185-577(-)